MYIKCCFERTIQKMTEGYEPLIISEKYVGGRSWKTKRVICRSLLWEDWEEIIDLKIRMRNGVRSHLQESKFKNHPQTIRIISLAGLELS